MNIVCMKDRSCPEIKLFIPAGNYNSPQHLVEQIQIAIEEKCGAIRTSNPQYDLIKL